MKQYEHNSLTHTDLVHKFSLSADPCITIAGTNQHSAEAVWETISCTTHI